MVNCSFCDKQVKRLVFCCPSHKVMYHRKGKKPATQALHTDTIALHDTQALHTINTPQQAQHIVQALPTHRGLCKHGHMIGLCNHGC